MQQTNVSTIGRVLFTPGVHVADVMCFCPSIYRRDNSSFPWEMKAVFELFQINSPCHI